MAEQVKVQQIEKEAQVKVQEAEINRREKELIATVLKGAEIERQRIETLAAAEKATPDRGGRRDMRPRFGRRARLKRKLFSRKANPKPRP